VIVDISKATSRKRCKIGGKLVLITNRKSYIGFRLVPKSMTLNYLERRNGPYSVLFHGIRVRCRRKKYMFAISSPDEFLVYNRWGLGRSYQCVSVRRGSINDFNIFGGIVAYEIRHPKTGLFSTPPN